MRIRERYDRCLLAFVLVTALFIGAGAVAWAGDLHGSSFLVADSMVIYNTGGGLGEGYVGRPHVKKAPRNVEPFDESFLGDGYSSGEQNSSASTVINSTNGGLGEGYVGRPHKKRAPRQIAFPEKKAAPIKSTVIYTTGEGPAGAASAGAIGEGWKPAENDPSLDAIKAFMHRIFPGLKKGEPAKPAESAGQEKSTAESKSPSTVIYNTDTAQPDAASAGAVGKRWQPSTDDHSFDSIKAFIHKIFSGDEKAEAAKSEQSGEQSASPSTVIYNTDTAQPETDELSERRGRRSLESGTIVGGSEDVMVPAEDVVETELGEDDFLDSEDEFDDEFNDETGTDDQAVADPLEGFNRAMFVVNDRLYFWFLRPVASGYSRVVPEPGRVAVRRFFTNAFMPIRFANNVLQFKFKYAGIELERFVINTTVGVAGFMDPAKSRWNILPHAEDFGQTLGFYGMGPGLYINLPFFGPSNIRDALGMVGDLFLSPTAYILPNDREIVVGISAYNKLNEVSLDIGLYEDIKRDALDPYIFIRNAYHQHRESLIKE